MLFRRFLENIFARNRLKGIFFFFHMAWDVNSGFKRCLPIHCLLDFNDLKFVCLQLPNCLILAPVNVLWSLMGILMFPCWVWIDFELLKMIEWLWNSEIELNYSHPYGDKVSYDFNNKTPSATRIFLKIFLFFLLKS